MFKIGDECFDVLSGNICLVLDMKTYGGIVGVDQTNRDIVRMNLDGKEIKSHKYPRFITIEEAKNKGLIKKDPIKIEFETTVKEIYTEKGMHRYVDSYDLYGLSHKNCRVTIEILEDK